MVYYEAVDYGGLFIGLAVFFVAFALVILFVRNNNKQGSHFYRRYLTNLYVAGRIKQLAEKDKVDLKEVEKDFIKYDSMNNKSRIRDLDEQIERELMDKVEESLKAKTETKKE